MKALHAELARQSNAAALAHDEATNEESRARSKYDTHSQEAAYLAHGQAKLALEIEASLEAYAALPLPSFGAGDRIALGAVVDLEGHGKRSRYFLGPRSGGLEVSLEGEDVLVVTPQSPLGRELLGKQKGDEVRTASRGRTTMQRIVAVE